MDKSEEGVVVLDSGGSLIAGCEETVLDKASVEARGLDGMKRI